MRYYYLFFIGFLFSATIVFGQNSDYKKYRKVIPGFMAENVTIRITEIEDKTKKEIDVINFEGDVLRFKVDKNNHLLSYYANQYFILYDFTGEWITGIRFFNQNGRFSSIGEFLNFAYIKFEIKNPQSLKIRLKTVEEHEGNIDMADGEIQLVLRQNLNSKNEVVSEYYISSDEYWDMLKLELRP